MLHLPSSLPSHARTTHCFASPGSRLRSTSSGPTSCRRVLRHVQAATDHAVASCPTINGRQQQQPAVQQPRCIRGARVGIYGVSCAGKTTLLEKLKAATAEERVLLVYDSSDVLRHLAGGMAMRDLQTEEEKQKLRCRCLEVMAEDQALAGGLDVVVAGHASFPLTPPSCSHRTLGLHTQLTSVWSQQDHEFYDTIVLLQPADPAVVFARSSSRAEPGKPRDHQRLSLDETRAWMEFEAATLAAACSQPGAPRLIIASDPKEALAAVVHALRLPAAHTEAGNRRRLQAAAAGLAAGMSPGDDVLLLDGDGTLTPSDTTRHYCSQLGVPWERVKACFSSREDYGGFGDFRRLALLLDSAAAAAPSQPGPGAAAAAAQEVQLDAPWTEFLTGLPRSCPPPPAPSNQPRAAAAAAAGQLHILLLTAGRRDVWQAVLENHGLADRVLLLASGRDFVVDRDGKAAVAGLIHSRLSDGCGGQDPGKRLLCVGDSVLDLPMLQLGCVEPVIVPRRPQLVRAASALQRSRDQVGGFPPPGFKQLVYPGVEAAAGDAALPAASFAELARRWAHVRHFTAEPWALHLATQTRAAAAAGHTLAALHGQAGAVLAALALAPLLPLERVEFPGVQGAAHGSRLADNRVTIISMERAGRPLAEGVWRALPQASLHPHNGRADVEPALVAGRHVIVCDAVVNTGASVRALLAALAALRPAQLAVVCLVMQEEAQALAQEFPLVSFVAMRLSSNKFKGRGGTDTGHRLYNTTYLH